MMTRIMGKAASPRFAMAPVIFKSTSNVTVAEGVYNQGFKKWDIGDLVGASGTMFRTRTGELSVEVDNIELLTKSLRPLPEKFHGLADQELRYRHRYVDLIVNQESREVFRKRSAVVRGPQLPGRTTVLGS